MPLPASKPSRNTTNNPVFSGPVPGYEQTAENLQPRFRKGRIEDGDAAAALIYAAGPSEFRFVFSITHHDQALEFLQWAWAQGGQFGYDEHLCIDVDGKIIATGIARTSASTRRLFFKSLKQIFAFYSFGQALKVCWNGLRAEHNVPPAQPGQRYIADIAVAPEHRGQGLAHALVTRLITFFPEQNLVTTLHVNANNHGAKRVYTHLGFEDVELCRSALKREYGEIGEHWKMEINT